MEDFNVNHHDEHPQSSSLQAEFLESQMPKGACRTEPEIAQKKQDKPQGPGKDVADRLDRELRDFATAGQNNPSADMQNFQKMISKFCDSPDKAKAMNELGDSYSRLKVQMEKNAEKTYNELESEGNKQPGRKALKDDYMEKLDGFFAKVDALPPDENKRVMNLLSWDNETESSAHHREVVRAGLANNKGLLASFNSMEAAQDKIEANKSPREHELETTHNQQIHDYHAMKPVVEKAYIRSTISC